MFKHFAIFNSNCNQRDTLWWFVYPAEKSTTHQQKSFLVGKHVTYESITGRLRTGGYHMQKR